jgi:hypothetical protein
MISVIISFGFTTNDLTHLERLSDAKILRTFPLFDRNLKHNNKTDVIKYLLQWADVLENDLLEKIQITVNSLQRSELLMEDNIMNSLLAHYAD